VTDWVDEINGNPSPKGAPCYDCPMEHDCYNWQTDRRHECSAFERFMEANNEGN